MDSELDYTQSSDLATRISREEKGMDQDAENMRKLSPRMSIISLFERLSVSAEKVHDVNDQVVMAEGHKGEHEDGRGRFSAGTPTIGNLAGPGYTYKIEGGSPKLA